MSQKEIKISNQFFDGILANQMQKIENLVKNVTGRCGALWNFKFLEIWMMEHNSLILT